MALQKLSLTAIILALVLTTLGIQLSIAKADSNVMRATTSLLVKVSGAGISSETWSATIEAETPVVVILGRDFTVKLYAQDVQRGGYSGVICTSLDAFIRVEVRCKGETVASGVTRLRLQPGRETSSSVRISVPRECGDKLDLIITCEKVACITTGWGRVSSYKFAPLKFSVYLAKHEEWPVKTLTVTKTAIVFRTKTIIETFTVTKNIISARTMTLTVTRTILPVTNTTSIVTKTVTIYRGGNTILQNPAILIGVLVVGVAIGALLRRG